MSSLLRHPALWPMLALNPEPFLSSADPDSAERTYSELFGFDSERHRTVDVHQHTASPHRPLASNRIVTVRRR